MSAPITPGTHPRTHLSGVDGTKQPFNLFVPTAHDSGEPCPFVIALHGITASWRTWFKVTTICEVAEKEGWIVATPHGRGDSFYLGAGERDVLEVIDEVKRLCHVDESRIYLIGHSMGGWGTWSLACSHPDLFAAIAPMSSWAPLDRLENLEHLAPIIFHGTDDEPVPVEHSRRAAERLTELGIEHHCAEIPGVGHESSMISDVMPQIADWFRERRRVEEPNHVCIRAWTPSRGSNHWLRIDEIADRTQIAHLEGTREDVEIKLNIDNVTRFAMAVGVLPNGEMSWVHMKPSGSGGWIKVPDDEPVSPNPVAMTLPESITDVAERIAAILAKRFEADAALLHRSHLQSALPAGDVTMDVLLDLYLRPTEELCLLRVSSDDVLRSEFPEWWGEAVLAPPPPPGDAGDKISLVCLADVARRLELESEGLGQTVPAVLLSHVIEKGSF